MNVVCLDFEGVIVPDFWPQVAKCSNVPDLNLTTRDVKNYRELMERRVKICHKHNITLEQIQSYISQLRPYPGALDFINWIRERYQFVLLSDTFYEFAAHFMKELGYPTLFCHTIAYNQSTGYLEFTLRMDNQKAMSVKSLRELNFRVFASGDSYNDITMLQEAHYAAFFRAPEAVLKEFPQYQNLQSYEEMQECIRGFFKSGVKS
jgi:phosphoserine/homoserine phosphotransferase